MSEKLSRTQSTVGGRMAFVFVTTGCIFHMGLALLLQLKPFNITSSCSRTEHPQAQGREGETSVRPSAADWLVECEYQMAESRSLDENDHTLQ